MSKKISLLFVLIFSCVNLYAQTEKYTAPVKWERYKFSKHEISLELPKMPVSEKFVSNCNELVKEHYALYAQETVYQVVVASKQKISPFCRERELFNQTVFEESIERLKQVLIDVEKIDTVQESKITVRDKEVTKIVGKFTTHWVFNDLKNDKWLVLSISNRANLTANEKQFINAVNFGKTLNGIELGNGASQTLGDEEKTNENKFEEKLQVKEELSVNDSLRVVFKPRANYTDDARKNQIQGTINLRVTFLANGAVGAVTPTNFLPDGLTEQAKIAASRLVFLPQIVNGKPVNVIKTVQYSFTIY